ncbi:glutathione S-transferase [Glaesserella sp.]|uniref:glutathione S-transferase n=1 Tax=Glaesserella sp. TaxID=2094731 RepID=UPI00359F8888
MITLYALKQSRAYRIAWLLELLELEYKLELFERDNQTFLAPKALSEIHPLGKSPILKDGELVLTESGAIVEYLLTHYDSQHRFRPHVESTEYPNYLFWIHYAEGSLMPWLIMSVIFKRINARKMSFIARPIVHKLTATVMTNLIIPQLRTHLKYVEQSLANKTWLLGEQLSGADIMMSFPLQAIARNSPLDLPNIRAYVERLEQEPHFQLTEQKLGKFEL